MQQKTSSTTKKPISSTQKPQPKKSVTSKAPTTTSSKVTKKPSTTTKKVSTSSKNSSIKNKDKDTKKETNKETNNEPIQEQQQQKEEEEEPKIEMEIQLQQIVNVLEKLTEEHKTAFFIDPKGSAHVFFKYKGSCAELDIAWQNEMLANHSVDRGIEDARKAIYAALRPGDHTVFSFNVLRNLDEYFKSGNVDWWKPEILFDHQKILKEEYYKKVLMKPEEDKDIFGEPGGYYANEKFSLSLIYHQQQDEAKLSLKEMFQKLGLDHKLFTIIKIK